MGRASVAPSRAARLVGGVVATVGLIAGLMLGGTLPAATAATVAQPGVRAVVAPGGAGTGTPEAVSCPEVGACVGVGQLTFFTPGNTGEPVAYKQSGSSWTETAVPPPGGLTTTYLEAVSCPTTTWCLALGNGVQANDHPGHYVEIYASGVWTEEAAPAGLQWVSCSSPGTCMFVGRSSARLDGGAWQTETAPAGAKFTGVSCAPDSACVAIGYIGAQAEVYRQHRSRWTASPLSAPAPNTFLSGVACPTATSCTAVGSDLVDQVSSAVVAAITPTSASATALTGTDAPSSLTDVTCASADWCYASAWDQKDAEILSDGTWTATEHNDAGLSCPAANNCVGPFGAGRFVVDTDNHWASSTVPADQAPAATALAGVSCWAAGQCVAVGSTYAGPDHQTPLAMNRRNGRWVPTVFNRDGLQPGALDAVSCAPARHCVAVGRGAVASTPGGGHWSAGPLPAEAGSPAPSLDAVSCWAWLECVAVGFTPTSPERPVIERLSAGGYQPTLLSLPPQVGNATLTAVSCTSATRCAATGSIASGSRQRPMVAWLTGGTWQRESLGAGVLDAVSCPPTGSCVAVGTRVGHDMVATQAGSGWKATVSPVPTHAPSTTLSCPAAAVCWATASAGPADPELVSVSPTNARAVRAFRLTGLFAASLNSISCPTTTSCAVAGAGTSPRGWAGVVGLFDPSS